MLRHPTIYQKRADLALKKLPNFKYMSILSILNKQIKDFNFDPTANFLFCTTENEFYILDSHTFQVYGVIRPPVKNSITKSSFCAALHLLLIITHQTVWIYSIFTGDLIKKFDSPKGDYCNVANFSDDGRYLALLYNDGYYLLYRITQSSENDNNHDIPNFEKICEEKYDRSLVFLSYSTGCELIALGFDNGKVIIRTTGSQKSYQWLVEAYKAECEVNVYFDPNNAFEFMTRGFKRGDVKFFRIARYGMKPTKTTSKKSAKHQKEIECYQHFQMKNSLHIVTSILSADSSIFYAASTRRLVALKIEDATVINEHVFDDQNEVQSFYQIIPHGCIPHVAIAIEKSSIWIWDCLANQCQCVVQTSGDICFQLADWITPNCIMVQTNDGSINFYSCESDRWENKKHVVDVGNIENVQWSSEMRRILGEYESPEYIKTMMKFEKRGLKFFSEGEVDPNIDDSDSEYY